jgi:hypothetical protein
MLTATRISRELLPREVVLIGADDIKRGDWPLAVVEELIHGRDGKVRLMKLRTAFGTLLRPVQRIYPLEIYGEGVSTDTGLSGGVLRKGSDDLS